MSRNITKIETLPKLEKLKKVAAYARVSNGKDAMLHSLSAQISYYNGLIQTHSGWEFCGVYADEAKSGTRDNRENFVRLINDCRAGRIDMIITKSISRFARNTVTLLKTVRELKAMGIDVYFEEQNIHTISAEGELMLTILASYAQEESLSASENQKWRIRKCFQKGQIVNVRCLYGYDIVNDKLIPNPKQAEIVKEIFDRVIAGESYGSITRDFNRRKIKTPHGKEWRSNRIAKIVNNEKMIGDALLQKCFINNHIEKKQCINKGELPMYYAEETHEPIIDKDTFMRAKSVVEERRNTVNANRKQLTFTVFSGLIQCPKCGKNYRRMTSNGSYGYNCSTYLSKGKAFCHGKKIPETTLIEETMAALELTYFDEEAVINRIEKIVVPEPNHLIFKLKNGTEIERIWKDRSRKESWTPEMREAARQKTLQRREKQWRKQ